MTANDDEMIRARVEQWRVASAWLDDERWRELAALTPAAARRAAADMLDLAARSAGDPARERSSGLVVMRALFARLESGANGEPPPRRGG